MGVSSCTLSAEPPRAPLGAPRAMARRRRPLPPPLLVWLAVLFSAVAPAVAKTDKSDVAALNVMFNSMNKPSQLSGWKSSGGDPCDDDDEWKGIECSGSSVTEINLSGLELSGSLGYQLSSLKSATKFTVISAITISTAIFHISFHQTWLN